jgi:hypothetical protein
MNVVLTACSLASLVVLLLLPILILSAPFPDGYTFECVGTNSGAEGRKVNNVWTLVAEETQPVYDLGRGANFVENSNSGVLTSDVNWFRSTNTTKFTLTQNGDTEANGVLITSDGSTHSFNCFVQHP